MTNLPAETTEQGNGLMALLVKVASDPATDVAKLERLSALVEHQQKRQAEQEFYAAMTAAQAEMPRVFKNAKSQHHSYANLDAVIRDVTPIYTQHGFSLSFGTEESAAGRLRVVCRVAHVGGFAKDYQADVPIDAQGAKNPVQSFGSSVSYARRYLTLMIFNISTTDDDDADSARGHGFVTPEQVSQLEALFARFADPAKKKAGFLDKIAKVAALEDIPAGDFARYKTTIERSLAQESGK